jgi:hypothetical protein
MLGIIPLSEMRIVVERISFGDREDGRDVLRLLLPICFVRCSLISLARVSRDT